MIKKLKRLFSSETRLRNDFTRTIEALRMEAKAIDDDLLKRVSAFGARLDNVYSMLNGRLTRLEVLLEDELKAKEALSREKIKEARKQ